MSLEDLENKLYEKSASAVEAERNITAEPPKTKQTKESQPGSWEADRGEKDGRWKVENLGNKIALESEKYPVKKILFWAGSFCRQLSLLFHMIDS